MSTKRTLGSKFAARIAELTTPVEEVVEVQHAPMSIAFCHHPQEVGRRTLWTHEEQDNAHVIHTYFHPGQNEAAAATERVVAIIAGTQSGKTSYGPLWLLKEILDRGGGDFGVVTPSFALLDRKALPEFKTLFVDALGLGKYNETKKKFVFHKNVCDDLFDGTPTVVFFGYATNPDALESATWKAVWLDEAGQSSFKQDSYDAIRRRVSLNIGRILITTTPYNLGWLKTVIWDKWEAGDDSIRVVRFDSTTNPAFPPEEMEEARLSLPKWKFDQFYRGIFTRSAGIVYDSFIDSTDGTLCISFIPPAHWRRVIGVDFGPVNFAAVFFAQSPNTGIWYVYRTYYPGERMDVAEHVRNIVSREPTTHEDYWCVVTGGAIHEDRWRDEFSSNGLYIFKPEYHEVDLGIQAGYSMMATGRLKVMVGLSGLRKDLTEYSYEVDSSGDVDHTKFAGKPRWHRIDAFRYGNVYIKNASRISRNIGQDEDESEYDEYDDD